MATHIHVELTNALNTKTYASVFARPIHAGKGLHRTETDAVVIEAAQDQAALICEQLYNLPLDMYSDVMFVPFSKMAKSYTTTLKNVLTANSSFSLSVEELNIPSLSFHNNGIKKTSSTKSKRDILLSYNTPACPFIHDVDVDRRGGTSVIYNIEHEKNSRHFLETLPSLLEKNMTPEALLHCLPNDLNIDAILKPSKAKLARSTIRHSKSVEQKFKPKKSSNGDGQTKTTTESSYAAATNGSNPAPAPSAAPLQLI